MKISRQPRVRRAVRAPIPYPAVRRWGAYTGDYAQANFPHDVSYLKSIVTAAKAGGFGLHVQVFDEAHHVFKPREFRHEWGAMIPPSSVPSYGTDPEVDAAFGASVVQVTSRAWSERGITRTVRPWGPYEGHADLLKGSDPP